MKLKIINAGMDVLLIEDSPGDIRLTQEAFRAANTNIRVHVALDGEDALAFLEQIEPHAAAPRPDLILLDLNLPKKDGREVLKHIRGHDHLHSIPTVILTSSDAAIDIDQSYKMQANCYLSKPVQTEKFEKVARSINDFWFEKAQLPRPL